MTRNIPSADSLLHFGGARGNIINAPIIYEYSRASTCVVLAIADILEYQPTGYFEGVVYSTDTSSKCRRASVKEQAYSKSSATCTTLSTDRYFSFSASNVSYYSSRTRYCTVEDPLLIVLRGLGRICICLPQRFATRFLLLGTILVSEQGDSKNMPYRLYRLLGCSSSV